MPSTSGLPAVSSILSTERLVATRADGTTVSVLASGLPASGAAGGAGGVLSGSYPNPGFAVDMATQAELDAGLAGKANLDSVTGTLQPAQAPGSLPAVSGSLPTLADISFTATRFERPFDLLPERFVTIDDTFSSVGATDMRWLGGGTPPVVTAAGLQFGTTTNQGYAVLPGATFVSPCVCVQAWFGAAPASGSTRYIGIGLGYRAGLANAYFRSLFLYYNANNGGEVGLETRFNGGGPVQNGTFAQAPMTGPFGMAVIIHNRKVSLFFDTGAGWRFARVWDNISANLDFRTPANLVDMSPFVVGHSNGGVWNCTRLRAGYAGHTGLQNTYAIKYENGEIIYDERGRYFLQGTAALPSGVTTITDGWDFSHNAVWAVDPTTLVAEPVAKVFLQRGGLHANADISGVILYDRNAQLWRVCMQNSSNIGTLTAVVHQWTTRENLLSGIHTLSNPVQLALPQTAGIHGVWDLDLVWRADLGLWHAIYTASTGTGTFHPRFATSPDLVTFSTAGEDASFTGAEGCRFVKIGNVFYGCAASGAGGIRFYNLPAFTLARNYTPTGWPVTAPPGHANIIPVRIGGLTVYIMDSFDGTDDFGGGSYNYGNRRVYLSAFYSGAEYQLSTPPPRT
jgi:hypothetical protein